ncbi:MAG TPA: cytochrome b/b6 domain-containing protein [Halothiobacillus sp.]|nr:cytochrome b/b6 domain-containing protein [Halothiobacillus sp.]
MSAPTPPPAVKVRVWDLPIRAIHWLLVLAVIGLWYTAEVLDTVDNLDWHMDIGFVMIGLLVFRILWGFFGSETARFSHFVKSPGHIKSYIKSPSKGIFLGHNPLGALSVIAMLLSLLLQVGTGLFAHDELYTSAPLSDYVSSKTSALLTEIHQVNFNVLLGLIVLHLAAVAFYQFKKHDPLVRAMITGKRIIKAEETILNPNPRFVGWITFVIIALIAGGVGYVFATQIPTIMHLFARG